MTDLEVIKLKKECFLRQPCDSNCEKCELKSSFDETIRAYNHSIWLMEHERSNELVRVIRCKDCSYYQNNKIGCFLGSCSLFNCCVSEDGFCHDAKMIENN